MKKILLSAVAMAAMSVSVFAIDGKITEINFMAAGHVWISVTDASGTIVSKDIAAAGDIRKSMIAAALTAKSTNSDVTAYEGTVDGLYGWKSIRIK